MSSDCKACRWLAILSISLPILIFGGYLGLRMFPPGGFAVSSIIRGADRAEVALLDTSITGQSKVPEQIEITTGPIIVPEPIKSELARLLTSHSSYKPIYGAKMCEPTYGVKLRFVRGDEKVDYYFCFTCKDLFLMRNGVRGGRPDFSPSARRFAEIFHNLFPNDPVLLNLYRETIWDELLGNYRFLGIAGGLNEIAINGKSTPLDLTQEQRDAWFFWMRGLDPFVKSERTISGDNRIVFKEVWYSDRGVETFAAVVAVDEGLIQFPSENGGNVTIKFDDTQKQQLIAFVEEITSANAPSSEELRPIPK